MIGTVGTEEKAEKAKACSADDVVVYSNKDFVEEVNRITQGAGVNVIYDGVGKATLDKGKLLIKRGELSRPYRGPVAESNLRLSGTFSVPEDFFSYRCISNVSQLLLHVWTFLILQRPSASRPRSHHSVCR